jgi:ABC-2 type transport system permease protein
MNNNTARVFSYELTRNVRRKGFLFTTFGIPVIAFILLVGYILISDLNLGSGNNKSSDQNKTAEELALDFGTSSIVAGYVDLSGVFGAPPQPIEGIVYFKDEAAAQAALDAGDIDIYYIIAQDYLDTGDVTLISPTMAINNLTTTPIEKLLFTKLAANIDPNILLRLRVPTNLQKVNLQRADVVQNEGANYTIVYVFSIVFLLSVFMTNGYLMQSVIEEKETRLIEILVSAVRPTQLLTGKILALGLLGLLQIVVWIAAIAGLIAVAGTHDTGWLATIANIHIPATMLLPFLAYFLLGYLFFAAAFGAVGAISSSMQEGPQYATIFILPAAIPYYFFGLFVQSPNAPLPVIFSIFPLTSPLSMIMRLTVYDVPLWQVLVSLGLLALSLVGMMWLAGRMFRVQTLLSGQTPKARDLLRIIRG